MAQAESMLAYVKVFSEMISDDAAFNEAVQEATLTIDVLWGDQALRYFLSAPVIKKDKREQVVRAVFDKLGANEVWQKVFVMMVRKDRMENLQVFKNELRQFADERCGIIRGVAQSAVELNESMKEKLTAFFKDQLKSDIAIDYRVNPDVLGGLKVNLGGVVLDASLDSKIKEAKNKLLRKRA